jgi:hypothetical protein
VLMHGDWVTGVVREAKQESPQPMLQIHPGLFDIILLPGRCAGILLDKGFSESAGFSWPRRAIRICVLKL